jgi:hypothetical protein
MARRRLVIEGETWEVFPTGRTTVYGRDEFGLVFECGTGPARRRRYARYSPVGARFTEASLRELSDRQLVDLFHQSQPAWTAPESSYGAR